jgi:hypothetical protein
LGRPRTPWQNGSIQTTLSSFRSGWRQALVALSVVGPLLLLLFHPPIPQPQAYYNFADRRTLLGIPNFFDVTTNLGFLLVGVEGLRVCLRHRWGGMRPAWIALFVGLVSVTFGSGYFHWNPRDGTLVWDRVSLTVSFMALFAAILGERLGIRLGKFVLGPALCIGAASVFYWRWFDDLRFYVWIQFMPLLAIPLVITLFRNGHSHQRFLVAALGCYVLAKIAETYDGEIFIFTQRLFSGHSLKHLLAALGCYALVLMLKRRERLNA